MRVEIERYDPGKQRTFVSGFEVPIPTGETWTVMDVLDYVSAHLDPSLAYYKHSACDHGICGRCGVSVGGRGRLACTEAIDGGTAVLELAPVPGRVPVRDLVTRAP